MFTNGPFFFAKRVRSGLSQVIKSLFFLFKLRFFRLISLLQSWLLRYYTNISKPRNLLIIILFMFVRLAIANMFPNLSSDLLNFFHTVASSIAPVFHGIFSHIHIHVTRFLNFFFNSHLVNYFKVLLGDQAPAVTFNTASPFDFSKENKDRFKQALDELAASQKNGLNHSDLGTSYVHPQILTSDKDSIVFLIDGHNRVVVGRRTGEIVTEYDTSKRVFFELDKPGVRTVVRLGPDGKIIGFTRDTETYVHEDSYKLSRAAANRSTSAWFKEIRTQVDEAQKRDPRLDLTNIYAAIEKEEARFKVLAGGPLPENFAQTVDRGNIFNNQAFLLTAGILLFSASAIGPVLLAKYALGSAYFSASHPDLLQMLARIVIGVAAGEVLSIFIHGSETVVHRSQQIRSYDLSVKRELDGITLVNFDSETNYNIPPIVREVNPLDDPALKPVKVPYYQTLKVGALIGIFFVIVWTTVWYLFIM